MRHEILFVGETWGLPPKVERDVLSYDPFLELRAVSHRFDAHDFLSRMANDPLRHDGLGVIPSTIRLVKPDWDDISWNLESLDEWTFLQDGLTPGNMIPEEVAWRAWTERCAAWREGFLDLALDVIKPSYGVCLADVVDEQMPTNVSLFMSREDSWTTPGLSRAKLLTGIPPPRSGWTMIKRD